MSLGAFDVIDFIGVVQNEAVVAVHLSVDGGRENIYQGIEVGWYSLQGKPCKLYGESKWLRDASLEELAEVAYSPVGGHLPQSFLKVIDINWVKNPQNPIHAKRSQRDADRLWKDTYDAKKYWDCGYLEYQQMLGYRV